MPAKIKDTAVRLFSDEVVSQSFSHMPGRYLRGRWLSIDGMESVVFGANQLSAEARKGGHLSRPKISVQRQLTLDTWVTSHATYRRTFALLATSNLFLA